MVVAHRAGCNAFAAWLFDAGVNIQKRIRGAILVVPFKPSWSEDPVAPMNRIRVNFRTALVVGEDDEDCPRDWAQAIAHRIGAKYLCAPHAADLHCSRGGWQWGMKLMQDILLD